MNPAAVSAVVVPAARVPPGATADHAIPDDGSGAPAAVDPGTREYVERTVVVSTDPLAAEVRRRVMARPFDPRREVRRRRVRLRYADGVEHLVVSGHASVTSLSELRRSVSAADATTAPPAVGAAAESAVPARPAATTPEWAVAPAHRSDAVAGVRRIVLETGLRASDADLIAAVAVVLARVTGHDRAVVGTDPDGTTALTVEVTDDATREQIAAALAADAAVTAATCPAVTVDVGEPALVDEYRGWQPVALDVGMTGTRLVSHHRTDLVDADTATGIAHAVVAVLTAPRDRAVGSIELGPGAPASEGRDDRHDLPDLDAAGTLVAAVGRWTARTPDAVAVVDGDGSITYGELARAATAVARHLLARGVRPHDRVGVAVAPSRDLVPALLGVLLAGAAYVPLDPAHPVDRLTFAVVDAGLAAIVADDPAAFAARSGVAVPVLPVTGDDDPGPIDLPRVDGDDDAYVIHTSGTTGRPKGVVVTHRNVASLLAATTGLGFRPDDVWTLFHSHAFDFSVWELFGCLGSGGRLVVVDPLTGRDPEAFHRLLVRERVTVLNQTPSAFASLDAVDARDGGRLAVRLLLFGGEALDVGRLGGWLARHPAHHVVNLYGITETTVHSTWKTVDRDVVAARSRSVGRALPGWSLTVTDAVGRELPVGVAGEIRVGGAGVARGYLGRPELTAERFPRGPRGRVYRSGDRGRRLRDGEYEHLGRLDDQVKIRGYRIEPGEIRAVLLEDPAVRAAAVVVRRHDDDVFLAAYIVGTSADPARLRAALASRLPAHQLPRSVDVVAELPLTANGKLDEARLVAAGVTTVGPAPQTGGRPGGAGAATEPAPDAEHWLLDLWSGMLGTAVGADDNFFLLGGTSLLAFKVVSAARAAGWEGVTVRDLYRLGTARALAAALRAGATTETT